MPILTRRQTLITGTAALGALAAPLIARAQSNDDIVICSSSPITGVFANVGVDLNAATQHYVDWRNEQGGIDGRRLRFVWEDSAYRTNESVAIFRKLMAQENPQLYYGDSTGWTKAVSAELTQRGTTMSSAPSFSSDLADPDNAPYYFMSAPTYEAMMGVLLRYIHAQAGASSPRVALIYSDTEFGRDPIEAAKRLAEELNIEIVAEIITRPGGVDVSPEVVTLRRAQPEYVIFHGYVLAPIPEFIQQLREARVDAQCMGTVWSMDKTTVNQMGEVGDGFMGVVPYSYSYESDGNPAMEQMWEVARRARPDADYLSTYYVHMWFTMMIYEEMVRRAMASGDTLDGPALKAALESIEDWDTGGFVGRPVSLSSHSIPIGRVYQNDAASGLLNPVSEWIDVS